MLFICIDLLWNKQGTKHFYTMYEASYEGRRLNGFQGRSMNDRTILFLVILLDKTVSVK